MLAALSQQTSRVGLGQLVTCASYRNAGLLAKEAACIDVYSGGRLILGLGAGWFHEEYHSYGYEYLSNPERLAVLDETLEVVRRLWTEETVTFDGDPPPLRRRLLRPQAGAAAAARPGRRRRREGQPAHRGPAGRPHQLAGESRGLRAQVAPAGPVLRGGRPAVRGDQPDPRPGLPAVRHRGGGAGLVRVGRRRRTSGTACPPIGTWPTTWSGRSTRSSRRPRRSWTPAAGASSCGCATSPVTRPSAGSWPRWCPP